jgi:hypothetical protein
MGGRRRSVRWPVFRGFNGLVFLGVMMLVFPHKRRESVLFVGLCFWNLGVGGCV